GGGSGAEAAVLAIPPWRPASDPAAAHAAGSSFSCAGEGGQGLAGPAPRRFPKRAAACATRRGPRRMALRLAHPPGHRPERSRVLAGEFRGGGLRLQAEAGGHSRKELPGQGAAPPPPRTNGPTAPSVTSPRGAPPHPPGGGGVRPLGSSRQARWARWGVAAVGAPRGPARRAAKFLRPPPAGGGLLLGTPRPGRGSVPDGGPVGEPGEAPCAEAPAVSRMQQRAWESAAVPAPRAPVRPPRRTKKKTRLHVPQPGRMQDARAG